MPNPLTLMNVVPQGAHRPDASSGKEGESKSGTAFENAMNEEASQSEAEAEQDAMGVAGVEVAPTEDSPPEAEETAQFTDSEPRAEYVAEAPENTLNPAPLVSTASDGAQPVQRAKTIVSVDHTKLVSAPVSTVPTNDANALPIEPAALRPAESDLATVVPKPPPTNVDEPNTVVRTPVRPENTVSVMEAIARHLYKSPASEAHEAATLELPRSQPAQKFNPSPSIVTPQVSVQPVIRAEATVGTEIEPESLDLPTLRETAANHTVREGPPGLPSLPARAETARAIAGQMSAAISAKPGAGGVEIALNPEELGRVSITLSGRDDGMHLMIMAERPETLDLMRRHIALLSAEFEKLGYAGLSLDLGTSGDTSPDDHQAEPEQTFHPTETAGGVETADPVRTGPDRGLDMRL